MTWGLKEEPALFYVCRRTSHLDKYGLITSNVRDTVGASLLEAISLDFLKNPLVEGSFPCISLHSMRHYINTTGTFELYDTGNESS